MGNNKIGGLMIFMLIGHSAIAQKNILRQSLYFIRYYYQLSLNKKFTLHNEFDDRRFFKNSKGQQFIIHSRLHYQLDKHTNIAVGLTHSLQRSNAVVSGKPLMIPEWRPVQEINYSNDLSQKISFQQRLRIDERFMHKHNGTALVSGYDFNFRFRYRIMVVFILNRPDALKPLKLRVFDELMINAGKTIVYNQFDQNRIFAGLDYPISKTLNVEMGFMHWYQQKVSGKDFISRDILRLTLFHKIKLLQTPAGIK